MLIGIISDTHGLMRPQLLASLQEVQHIVHAGDIGSPDVLSSLRNIAPVTAIRGNIDVRGECAALPETDAVELGGHLFYLIHSVHDLDINPTAAKVDVIVSGHSHLAEIEARGGVLYVNPGSCGPKRFALPVSIALITIRARDVQARIVELPV